MGVMYLSAALKSRGHQASLLDLRLHPGPPRIVIDWLTREKPDLVGISAISTEAKVTQQLTAMIEQSFPDLPIVVGGPYPSTAVERAMSDPNVDYCVLGEAELSFPGLVEHIVGGGKGGSELPGVAWREGGELRVNPPPAPIQDLDTLPMPDWDLIEREEYFRRPRIQYFKMERKYMPLFSSRGCPFQCLYCHQIFGKKFRPHSVARTLAEIDALYTRYGIHEFQVFDDIFNLNLDRAKAICRGIIATGRKIHLTFPNGLRADRMDEELIQLLKAAGTFKITYAVETASPRLQKLIRKNVDLDKARAMIEITDRENLFQTAFFMIGFPTETEAEIRQTIKFACDSRLHAANFLVVNAFEGTGMAELARSHGMALDFEKYEHDYYKPRVQLSEVPVEKLSRILKQANRQMYLDPWRLPRLLKVLPNKMQLPEFAWLFLRLAFAR